MLSSWLPFRKLAPGARRKQRCPAFRPTLEELERRLVPALSVTPLPNDGTAVENLVNTLLGPGISASNISSQIYIGKNKLKDDGSDVLGNSSSAGTFTGGAEAIGFDEGIILSTGGVKNVLGPNEHDEITQVNGLAGDDDLDDLAGFPTVDATVLEFDFVPTENSIAFQYVFASDEYNEFVDSEFNDVFAFYVNGVNVAVVPNSVTAADPDGLPVSINTINNNLHPFWYFDNDSGARDLEMDGMTLGLFTIQAPVTPDVTNHIKLAIADGSDAYLDSNVFLRAGSFTSVNSEFVIPTVTVGNSFQFQIPSAPPLHGPFGFYDPAVAVGYDYEIVSGPNFAQVLLPTGFGDNLYTLHLDTDLVTPGIQPGPAVATLTGGVAFDLTTLNAAGLSAFQIMGIEIAENVDPDDGLAFATGLTFMSNAAVTFNMTPVEALTSGASFLDEDGDKVSVKLVGGGQVAVLLDDSDNDGAGAIAKILLENTGPKSNLMIKVAKKGSGDGVVSVGAIEGGQLKMINGLKAKLEDGAGIELTGFLGFLKLNSVTDADITLAGLGKAIVTGKVENSNITVNSSVASFSVGKFVDSTLFLAYEPDDALDPMAGGTFASAFTLGGFNAKGIKGSLGQAFVNSTVAAATITNASLASVQTDNSANGGVDFGIIAEAIAKVLTRSLSPFEFDPDAAIPQGVDDFVIDIIV